MAGNDQNKKDQNKRSSLFGKKKKKPQATANKKTPAATSAVKTRNRSNAMSITGSKPTAATKPTTAPTTAIAMGGHRAAPAPKPAWQGAKPSTPAPKSAAIGEHRADKAEDPLRASAGPSAYKYAEESAALKYATPSNASQYSAPLSNGSLYSSPLSNASHYSTAPQADGSQYKYSAPQADASHYSSPLSNASHYSTAPQADVTHYSPVNNLSLDDDDDDEYEASEDEDDDDDLLSDDEDDDDAPPAVAPVAARNTDPFNLGKGHLVTTPLHEHYHGEEYGSANSRPHLPDSILGAAANTTKYAAKPEEHRASVQDGKLMRADGSVADSGAAQQMWQKDKAQRLNFVMDGHGSTYLSDPRKEFVDGANAAQASGGEAKRINHSTMLAGGDVAGAGTVRARDGKVEEIGDGSGHYKPSVVQTAQVAKTMAGQGVLDPQRSTAVLSGKGAGEKDVKMTSQELLSYGEGKDNQLGKATAAYQRTGDAQHLASPEATIRQRHGAKDRMLAELKRTTPETAAVAEGMGTKAPEPKPAPLKPNPVAPVAAPTAAPVAAPTAAAAAPVKYTTLEQAMGGAPAQAAAPVKYSQPASAGLTYDSPDTYAYAQKSDAQYNQYAPSKYAEEKESEAEEATKYTTLEEVEARKYRG